MMGNVSKEMIPLDENNNSSVENNFDFWKLYFLSFFETNNF
jgi:hypothetical protein